MPSLTAQRSRVWTKQGAEAPAGSTGMTPWPQAWAPGMWLPFGKSWRCWISQSSLLHLSVWHGLSRLGQSGPPASLQQQSCRLSHSSQASFLCLEAQGTETKRWWLPTPEPLGEKTRLCYGELLLSQLNCWMNFQKYPWIGILRTAVFMKGNIMYVNKFRCCLSYFKTISRTLIIL